MTAITETAANPSSARRIRPFDARRDLETVADLVELCFAETLDVDGRRYLRRMRLLANNRTVWNWAPFAPELSGLSFSGYVWEQDHRVVGNISVIPYYLRGRRFYLIANVAVHPEYRRQGIARRLTERAIEHARRRSAPSVWLHVRDENAAAVRLYQDLGFIERTRRTTWRSGGEAERLPSAVDGRISALHPSAWSASRKWLLNAYPPQYAWHLSLDMNLLRPDFLGGGWRLLNNAQTAGWMLVQERELKGMVSWQASRRYSDHLWLAAPESSEPSVVTSLLSHARRCAPTHRSFAVDYPAGQFSQAFLDAGFMKQQTLIWMEQLLDL